MQRTGPGRRRTPQRDRAWRGPAPIWLTIVLLGGCQSPFLVFSGQQLRGPVAEAQDFGFACADYTLLKLEVRPERPYSVFLRVACRDGVLYLDAAQRRRWHTYLKDDPRIRIQLGDTIYPARAVRVDDPQITGRFLGGRTIYRVVPRPLDGDR